MENSENKKKPTHHQNTENVNQVQVETDYEAHAHNPKPAPTVNEPENKGAGPTMKWVIPLVIILLAVIYFLYFRNNMTD